MQALKQLIETIKSHEVAGQHEIRLGNPATQEEIASFEITAGYPLTESLKALYQFANGLVFVIKGAEYRIMSLKEAERFLKLLSQYQLPQLKRSFPLFDNNDSNLWLLCCAEPLEDYIIYLPHDGEMAVKYRSLDSLFAIMNWYILPYFSETTYQHFSMSEMPSDMNHPLKLSTDDVRGRQLLEIADPLPQWDRVYGISLALNMISENSIDGIQSYLYDWDEFVSRAVYYRIKDLAANDFKARHIIKNFEQEIEEFAEDCAEALRQAGLEVIKVEIKALGSTIHLNHRSIRLNILTFFAARSEHEDIMAYVVEQTKALIELKSAE